MLNIKLQKTWILLSTFHNIIKRFSDQEFRAILNGLKLESSNNSHLKTDSRTLPKPTSSIDSFLAAPINSLDHAKKSKNKMQPPPPKKNIKNGKVENCPVDRAINLKFFMENTDKSFIKKRGFLLQFNGLHQCSHGGWLVCMA